MGSGDCLLAFFTQDVDVLAARLVLIQVFQLTLPWASIFSLDADDFFLLQSFVQKFVHREVEVSMMAARAVLLAFQEVLAVALVTAGGVTGGS